MKKTPARYALSFAKSCATIPIYQAAFSGSLSWGQAIPRALAIIAVFLLLDFALALHHELKQENGE